MSQRGREAEEFKTYFRDNHEDEKVDSSYTEGGVRGTHPVSAA